MPRPTIEQLREAYFDKDLSLRECAKLFGVTPSTISGMMTRARDVFPKGEKVFGIKRRTYDGSRKESRY